MKHWLCVKHRLDGEEIPQLNTGIDYLRRCVDFKIIFCQKKVKANSARKTVDMSEPISGQRAYLDGTPAILSQSLNSHTIKIIC